MRKWGEFRLLGKVGGTCKGMKMLLGELMKGELPVDRFAGLRTEIEQLLVVRW